MPRNMAMRWPHSRVVRLEFNHYVTRPVFSPGLQDLRIPSLWIALVHNRRPVPSSNAFGQHPEIVPVEVHWVVAARHTDKVVDDETDRGVGAEVVDVPLRVERVGGVAKLGEQEERVAVCSPWVNSCNSSIFW